VALSTEKPPQSRVTILLPINGKALNKLVITVAPQSDIWPHGNTYPINAVAIIKIKMTTPIVQTAALGVAYEP